MTEQDVFVLGDRTLNDVVLKIADDQGDMRMPATFARFQITSFRGMRA